MYSEPEKNDDGITLPSRIEQTLRGVDLNLLTVFDAVMQEQNITRAAHNLKMSQPAVSNAVSRLKIMFSDELFIRHGRGIQPTQRAHQIFGPIHQALQLIRNELPSTAFSPETSNRLFRLAVCSPCDVRFAPKLLTNIAELAPNIHLHMDAEFDTNLIEKMRYQEVDFVIDYTQFDIQGFVSSEIFSDELVVVTAAVHPRIGDTISEKELITEKHAQLSKLNGMRNFSEQAYRSIECQAVYQGTSLSNVLYVVSQSELITIAPRWLVESLSDRLKLKVLHLPLKNKYISGYLSWHESNEKDRGHIWMRDQLMIICDQAVANA